MKHQGRKGTLPAMRPAPAIWLGWGLFGLMVANAGAYMVRTAIPLIISDGWYFLLDFVGDAANHTLTIGDFFAKRTAIDHSMPLNRLLILVEYRYFDLDPTVDAYVGMAFAVGTLLVLRQAIRQSTQARFAMPAVQLGFAAICAVYLSLNASAIFEWPLLTMGFGLQFFSFLLIVGSWHAVSQGRFILLGLMAAACLLVADGAGVITVIATILTLALGAAKGWRRHEAQVAIIVLGTAMAAYLIGYRLLAPPFTAPPLPSGLGALFAIPHLPLHLVGWVQSILADAIALPRHAVQVFGSHAHAANATLAVIVGFGHVWFWYRALRLQPSVAWHVAVCTMLLFYGAFAGMLIDRVPAYGGSNYSFDLPRYVIFYQLSIVAILMLAVDTIRSNSGRRGLVANTSLVAASLSLIFVQVLVTRHAWERMPFQQRYVQHLAEQTRTLAADPGKPPNGCLPLLTICSMPEVERERAMALLEREQLNLFSASFRARHAVVGQ